MSNLVSEIAELSRLVVVTVTYHPDMVVLARQMALLPAKALWVVVDNASLPEEVAELSALVASRDNTQLLACERNLGLAAALNAGAALAAQVDPAIEFYLLMDQDSEPGRDSITLLLQRFLYLEQKGLAVGCVGPRLVDDITGLQHGFHCMEGLRWVRRYPEIGDRPLTCANMNGSGTLVRRSLFEVLGGLDEDFFIDHIDTDWAFRVIAAGYDLFAVPEAVFLHRMGESSFRFWLFGWRIWPQRSPIRHYFLFRNAIRLLRRAYVPKVWKGWAVIKLAMTFVVHLLFDSQRREQVRHMYRGVSDGFK